MSHHFQWVPGPRPLSSSLGSPEYRAGQGTGEGKVCKEWKESWGRGPGRVSGLGAFFDSEILELSLAFGFKASCITLGSSGSSFSGGEAPPFPLPLCVRLVGCVCLSVFVCVSVCARDSLWVSLYISFPYMWEEEVLLSLCFSLDLCVPASTSHPHRHLSVSFLWIFLSFSPTLNAQNSWLSWCLR